MKRTRWLFVLLAASVFAAVGFSVGCENASQSNEAGTLDPGEGPWAPGEAWVVEPEPILELGGMEGPETHQFYRVRNAFLLDSGILLVANAGTLELRAFDLNGEFLRSYGGSGEGPGEFRSMAWARRVHGDSVLVYDGRLARISLFAPSGESVRTVQLNPIVPLVNQAPGTYAGTRVLPIGAFAGGTVFGSPVFPTSVRTAGPPRVRRDTLPIFFFSSAGVPETGVGPLEGDEYYGGAGNSMLLPFGHRLHLAGGDARIAVGDGVSSEISVLSPTSDTLAIFRWEPETDLLSEQNIEEYKDWYLSRFDEGTRRTVARELDMVPFPRQMPTFVSLLWDRLGNLWIERYQLPFGGNSISAGVWDVISPEGVWKGAVRVPPGLEVTAIGRDHVVGLVRDNLDLEYVRVYQLRKGQE
jgi:hypothetical protein